MFEHTVNRLRETTRVRGLDTVSRLTLTSLVGGNLILLVGVLWWDWRPLDLLLLYWLENGVIAAFNVPKLLFAVMHSVDFPDVTTPLDGVSLDWDSVKSVVDVLLACLAFLVSYGFFWFVNGLVVLLLPMLFVASGWSTNMLPFLIVLRLGSLLVSHVVSFLVNYLFGEEYRDITPRGRIEHLYSRVAVLYSTIFFGVAVHAVGSPVALIAFLVVLKTGLDIRTHLRDHVKATPTESDRNPGSHAFLLGIGILTPTHAGYVLTVPSLLS
jgi:hypothetical protein